MLRKSLIFVAVVLAMRPLCAVQTSKPEPPGKAALTTEEKEILKNRDLLENLDLLQNLDKFSLFDLFRPDPESGKKKDSGKKALKEDAKKVK
jgi:hypothetical protein